MSAKKSERKTAGEAGSHTGLRITKCGLSVADEAARAIPEPGAEPPHVGRDAISCVCTASGPERKGLPEPPRSREELATFCSEVLGLAIPSRALCSGHAAPLDYLWHSWSADERRGDCDAVVWANRGGGKTMLAAVATVLDAVYKPGCEVRLLAGSAEQARRAYRYVVRLLNHAFPDLIAGVILKGGCRLTNGSTIELMTQSQTSVRGQHIQKLRCDEVELFDEEVLAAAKLTTQSHGPIRASMELLSTMHRPYGIMHEEVTAARARGAAVFHWCPWETIERCTRSQCFGCPLDRDCHGVARKADGYLRIDDVLQHMARTSRSTWESEVLCSRPSTEGSVFPDFDRAVHVHAIERDPRCPMYRSIDFGFVHPFVCLWLQRTDEGHVHVFQEYVRRGATIHAHADALLAETPGGESSVSRTFCDPAGAAREGLAGSSMVRELLARGIQCHWRSSGIADGIDAIRAGLCNAAGGHSLTVHPRCARLIEALEGYHYPEGARVPGEIPYKDGVFDHPIDALRYFYVNAERSPPVFRRY